MVGKMCGESPTHVRVIKAHAAPDDTDNMGEGGVQDMKRSAHHFHAQVCLFITWQRKRRWGESGHTALNVNATSEFDDCVCAAGDRR
ncbi:unnamed protein product [Arctogadus glacialis]